MYFPGKRLCIEDWVQRGDEVGQVVACVEEGSDLSLIVMVASVVKAVSRRGRLCTLAGGLRSLWGLADSHVVAAWRPTATTDEVHVMMQ